MDLIPSCSVMQGWADVYDCSAGSESPFFNYFNASWHIVNVPTASHIFQTINENSTNNDRVRLEDCRTWQWEARPVWKPLGHKSSAGTRKFPAAAFTRMPSFPKCFIVDSTTLNCIFSFPDISLNSNSLQYTPNTQRMHGFSVQLNLNLM